MLHKPQLATLCLSILVLALIFMHDMRTRRRNLLALKAHVAYQQKMQETATSLEACSVYCGIAIDWIVEI